MSVLTTCTGSHSGSDEEAAMGSTKYKRSEGVVSLGRDFIPPSVPSDFWCDRIDSTVSASSSTSKVASARKMRNDSIEGMADVDFSCCPRIVLIFSLMERMVSLGSQRKQKVCCCRLTRTYLKKDNKKACKKGRKNELSGGENEQHTWNLPMTTLLLIIRLRIKGS